MTEVTPNLPHCGSFCKYCFMKPLHYGADAFGTEPLPQASPLRGLPNALLTPHIAWATNEALQRLMDITANNLRTWLDGAGENIVNA